MQPHARTPASHAAPAHHHAQPGVLTLQKPVRPAVGTNRQKTSSTGPHKFPCQCGTFILTKQLLVRFPHCLPFHVLRLLRTPLGPSLHFLGFHKQPLPGVSAEVAEVLRGRQAMPLSLALDVWCVPQAHRHRAMDVEASGWVKHLAIHFEGTRQVVLQGSGQWDGGDTVPSFGMSAGGPTSLGRG